MGLALLSQAALGRYCSPKGAVFGDVQRWKAA